MVARALSRLRRGAREEIATADTFNAAAGARLRRQNNCSGRPVRRISKVWTAKRCAAWTARYVRWFFFRFSYEPTVPGGHFKDRRYFKNSYNIEFCLYEKSDPDLERSRGSLSRKIGKKFENLFLIVIFHDFLSGTYFFTIILRFY